MRYVSTFLLGFLLFQLSYAQSNKNDYYIFPIKPGERNSLSGTMGELRSNHFHAGLDIRTEGRTGLSVHAAAEGYISRISVSRGGYGNALYIAHPNGTTTVYAHLQEFKGPVADHVREMQYDKQSFELTLYFKAEEFPVKQGDVVALSGNSGSSGGPHVHFDLRDRNQDLLNPLHFGFEEILDTRSPEVKKVAFKSLQPDSRVFGKFGRFEYPVTQDGNNYTLENPVEVYGEVGIELYAYDRIDDTRFRYGITTMEVKVDGQVSYAYDISTFAFSEQRNSLRHMDYAEVLNSRERYHKLYVDDGNFMRFYTTDKHKGKIHAKGNRTVPVEITMSDSYGNTSTFSFRMKYIPPEEHSSNGRMFKSPGNYLRDNTLAIVVPVTGSENTVGINNHTLSPAFRDETMDVFLWDLREELPENIEINGINNDFKVEKAIAPQKATDFKSETLSLSFPANALFDTLYLYTDYSNDTALHREYFSFGNRRTPLRKSVSVTLHPELEYENKDKVVAYVLDASNNAYYKGGTWKGNDFAFKTREFGRYTLLEDTQKPTIKAMRLTENSLQFKIDDAMSGIKSFDCYVNGEWVLMYYDYKRKLLWSEKRSKDQVFSGEVKLVVRDNVNNTKEFTTKIE